MRALAVGIQVVATDETIGGGIDDRELVLILDRDQNAPRAGVIVRIAGLAADVDGRHHLIGRGVDDELTAAGFIGDEDLLDGGDVVEPVGEVNLPGVCDDPQALGIDDCNVMTPGSGHKEAIQFRHGQHAGRRLDAIDGPHHLLGGGVEHHDLIGAHVGEVEPA